MATESRRAMQFGSVPLYVAGAATQCAALAVLGNQMPSSGFVLAMMLLTLAGFTGAWILRGLGLSSGFLRIASLGLVILTVVLLSGQGIVDPGSSSRMVSERQLITTMALVASVGAFFLVTDESVAFTGVWGLAIIGLAATTDVNFSLIAAFATFLLGVVFVLVHQHALAQAPIHRKDSLAHGRLLMRQFSVAAGLWAAAIALATMISIPLRMVGRNLSLSQVVDQLRVAGQNQQRRTPVAGRLTEAAGQFSIGLGPIRDDRTIVMRVWAEGDHLWRGRTYSIYTGRSWLADENSGGGQELSPTGRQGENRVFELPPATGVNPSARRSLAFRVQTSSPALSLIYQPGDVRRIDVATEALYRNPDGSVGAFNYLSGYAAVADVVDTTPQQLDRSGLDYPDEIRRRYLRMDSNPRLAALAAEATRGKTGPGSKAEAIRAFVAQRCTYTLQARRVPEGKDAVEFFLTDSKEGYCDLYASAVAVLARHAGLPSRIATGFSQGEPDEEDSTATVLRESHRHAWPEIWFEGYGWVAFDPTATTADLADSAAQNRGNRGNDWLAALRRFFTGPGILVLGGVAGLALVFWSGRRVRTVSPGESGAAHTPTGRAVVGLYANTLMLLRRHGVLRPVSQTPRELAVWVRVHLGGDAGEAVATITRILESVLYANQTPGESDVAVVRDALARLRSTLKKGRV